MRKTSILLICLLCLLIFVACEQRQVPLERVRQGTEAQKEALYKGLIDEFHIEKLYFMEPASPTDGIFIAGNIYGPGVLDIAGVFYMSAIDGSGKIYSLNEPAEQYTDFQAPDAAAQRAGITLEAEDAGHINKFVGRQMFRVHTISQ